jgi:carbon-monoxide dehydrogenase large subunit
MEIACERDGRILAMRGRLHVDIGAYPRSNGLTAPRNVCQFVTGPYQIAHVDIQAKVHFTNKMGTGTYRAPGRYEANFFCERLVEIAARDLGVDPVEMRRRNLITEDVLPYPMAFLTPEDLYSNTECDSGDYHEVFQRCLVEFDWIEKRRMQGQLINGRYHGLAVGCFIEGGAAGPKENAKIVLEPNGEIAVYVGSASLGQGLETVLTQIAADCLDTSMESIRLYHGSTTYLKEGFGSYHSRSTVMGGSAILLAAEKLKTQMREAAAKRLGCAVEAVKTLDGTAVAPDGRSIAYGELAAEGLQAEASFENHHKHTYAYGTAAAHVAVDPKTGHIEVLEYLVVEDVGRMINPLTLHGQVLGATVQGLGSVFMEEIVYDEHGQLLTGSLADYMIPTASDYPNIKAITLELRRSPTNPLGTKGAGEGGIIGVGGVVSNAVAAALAPLGIEPNVLPLSPPRIWKLIQEARQITR